MVQENIKKSAEIVKNIAKKVNTHTQHKIEKAVKSHIPWGFMFIFIPLAVLLIWVLASFGFWIAGGGHYNAELVVNRVLGVLFMIGLVVLLPVGSILLAKEENQGGFTVMQIVSFARKNVKNNIIKYLPGFCMIGFLQLISNIRSGSDYLAVNYLFNIIYRIIYFYITFGIIRISLDIVYQRQYEYTNIFVKDWSKIWKGALGHLIYQAAVMFGLLLLIVPGIVIALKLFFVPYLILEKDLKPIDAIKTSRYMTDGFIGQIFLLNFLLVLINAIGFLAAIIGIIWTLPVMFIANAYIYKKVIEFKKI